MNNAGLMKLRETKFVSSEVETVKLDGTFTGYASVYNKVDLGNDIIAPRAFEKSLQKRGSENIRMLFQHDPNEPIGVWKEIVETTHGLRVKGCITNTTGRGREVLELMRAGAVDGLSIGFKTVRSRLDPITKARRILEADLWEISVVTFPMQESARVETVKSTKQLKQVAGIQPSIRQFEKWLVRDAGLSRNDAHLVITKGYQHALGQRDAALSEETLAERIRHAASNFLQ